SLNWGDVLEIQGPSGSGKTQLLYLLLATCTMPCSLGGWGKAAVVFDTEGSFDLRNLHSVLLSRLVLAFSRSNPSSDDVQLLAETALHKVHIFRPASTLQLAASIYNLPAYQKTHMPDADIGLVAVDSLSAFYWPDRFTAEQLRPLTNSSATSLQHVLTSLQKFRLSHNPVTVLTNWALTVADNSDSHGPPPVFYKQHLPSFPS
ncbi:P-loop containing nucleoside triphosphate hydrolase protein, partial [Mycena haematopus]